MPYTVYKLHNPATDAVYYGSTSQPTEDRFGDHTSHLTRGYHFNSALQAAYDITPNGWELQPIATGLTEEEARKQEARLIKHDSHAVNKKHGHHKQKHSTERVDIHVAEAVLMSKGSLGIIDTSRRYGISIATVSHIWNGKHWSTKTLICNGKEILASKKRDFLSLLNIMKPTLAAV